MTTETLWKQVSLDLQKEIGQACFLSTFSNSTLFEESPASKKPASRKPASEKSASKKPASRKPASEKSGLENSKGLTAAYPSQKQGSCVSNSLIPQSATGVAPKARAGKDRGGRELASRDVVALASQDDEAESEETPSLLLVVPNKFTRDNISSKYLKILKRIIAKYLQSPDEEISLSIQIRQVTDAIPLPTDFTSVLPQEQFGNRFSDSRSRDARLFSGGDDWGSPTQRSNGALPGGHSTLADNNGTLSRGQEVGFNHEMRGDFSPGPNNEPNQNYNRHYKATPNYNSSAGQNLPDLQKTPPFNPRFTFDNFVSGSTNRFAYSATLGVAEHPGDYYNPLFIFGNVGLGKTHLLQAVANYVIQHYPQKRALYVATETFLNDFLEALKKRRGNQFREKYRQLDVLILDDVQVLEGKESTQEEIFHTFNYLYENNKQLIFSSDRPPDALQTLENRLRSRFKSGLLADIQPPDIETRLIILQQNVEHQNRKLLSLSRPIIDMPQDVLNFIAENFKENIRELEGALTKVMAHSQLMGVSPTLDSTSDLLGDLISHSSTHFLSPQGIIKLATEMFKVSQDELTGQCRKQELVMPRHITMYAMREHTDLSYPAIGTFFSNRDHSSVMHAVSKVTKQIKEKREVYEFVVSLTSKINLARRSLA